MKTCDHCGQRIRKLNPHRMDRAKVAVLEMLAKAHLNGQPWVKALEGTGITIGDRTVSAPYRARAHASRLVWFGLAEHGEVRSGAYRITGLGLLYLFGRATVPNVIYCKDGIVVARSDEESSIHQVKNVVLDKPYWDNYPSIQIDDPRPRLLKAA